MAKSESKGGRGAEKMIPMRMIFTSIEVITFHDDHEALAAKIAAALPGHYVRIYENESSGHELVRRDQIGEIKP